MEEKRPNFEDSQGNERIERLRRAMYSRALSEKIKERDRREMQPTKPLVGEDWKHTDEGVPLASTAPRSIRTARYALSGLLLISILFFVTAVGYFTYFFFLGAGRLPASPNNIDIAVAGPPQVPSGQASQMQIIVTNRNPVPLENAELLLTYPAGTRSPTDYATDLQTQRIPLGTIAPGAQRQGTVTAVFSGKEGKSAHIKIELEYRISGTSAIFVATNDYAVMYSTSPLTVSVEGNVETISGQPVEFTASVASNASAPIKDALLKVEYPFGFKFKKATPEPTEEGFWELGDLAPGARRAVIIEGTLNGEAADERIFNFIVGTRRSSDAKQVDYPLSSYPFRLTISQPFLGLTVFTNKNSSSTVVVAPGDNVNVVIGWQNNLKTAITDAVIVAKLSGVVIDGAKVRTTDGFYRSVDNTMIWDKTTTNGKLKSLPPGAQGTVSFSFQVPPAIEIGAVSDPHLALAINASGNRVSETGVPENLQSTARQRIALATSLQFVAQGLYYQSPFGSSGPMPPTAGQETTYAIVFTINNTTNAIKGATVTALLPPYVRFAGHWIPKEADVQFNLINNTMTWNLNTIEPGVGLNDVPPQQMAIEIGFTPSTSQVGETPALLQDIVLNGVDAATGKSVSIEVPDVVTNLALPSKSSKDISIGSDKGFTPANATVVRPKDTE